MSIKHFSFLLFTVLVIGCRSGKEQNDVSLSEQFMPLDKMPKPEGTFSELGLAGYAKVLCSAVFVSARDPEEAFQNSGFFFMPEEDLSQIAYSIDYDDKSVTMTLCDTLHRRAKYYGSQGCIIDNGQGIFFSPVEAMSTLMYPSLEKWPMGDVLPKTGLPPEVDEKLLSGAVDAAFYPDSALTAAFLVLYKGQIIAERYREGIDMFTQLESWSMGKSLTATLIGRLIQMGDLQLDQPAPVKEWQQKGDPRGKIRIRDLMQMSSGLRFTAHRDPEAPDRKDYLDHFYIYSGAVDAFSYSVNRPLEFITGTEGRYRNCDPLILGYIVKQTVIAKGEEYLSWPQLELFDKIGINKQIMETDPYGNFLLTGYDYGTARNWARLGLLYLKDGLWNWERLLPEGWATFVSTPAPGWKEPVYGGQFWINGTGEMPIPKDAYYMAGAGGQRTIIIPSHNLVVVRLGHQKGAEVGMESLNKALEKLMLAIPGKN